MTPAHKLFRVRPENILEHPTRFPTTDIPLGEIEGWLAFAPQNNGTVISFVPHVIAPYEDKQRCIQTEKRNFGEGYEFWFGDRFEGKQGTPCWYQSGVTLRFVKIKT